MSVGFVILAHERPQHVARIARHLAKEGAPVVIHYDRRSPGREVLAREAGVPVLATQSGEWGMFGLVAATLDAVRELLAGAPTTRHVCLISGACLPLRPVAELVAFLAEHPETDFIESAEPRDWIRGGLDEERFTLHHPVPWRRRRWLFDRLVHAQRRLRLRRRLPQGLTPRLGRQWWCLTAASLRALLTDPRLPAWQRFFRTVWIPDESFFQSLIPLVA
ncbi:MAG: beta-1,6-N-acetylglucosaminyltransferase, partial [Pseudomonadota bacterium]